MDPSAPTASKQHNIVYIKCVVWGLESKMQHSDFALLLSLILSISMQNIAKLLRERVFFLLFFSFSAFTIRRIQGFNRETVQIFTVQ